MLIRNMVDTCFEEYKDVEAIKWLQKKEIASMSYEKLLANLVSIRKALSGLGFKGKQIALIGPSSPQWVESYLGIITGENIAVPLDVLLPPEDLIDLVNRSDSEGLFLTEKAVAMLPAFLQAAPALKIIWILQDEMPEIDAEVVALAEAKGVKLSCVGELLATGEKIAEDVPVPNKEDLATIIFTSGTTGKSKGVMLTQDNLATNVEAVEYEGHIGTVMLSVLPIHHAFCLVMDWLKGMSLGATVCINDSLLHMVKNISVFKPEVMLMVPLMIETIYKRISSVDPATPKAAIYESVFGGNLKIIFTGGAHLDPFYIEKFNEFGIEVLEGYGMSECSPVISSNTVRNHKAGSIGKPLANVEIKFVDGEILVKGTSVMKGYYKMPKETEETLADGWLHTGDKGYLDEDGYLFINGRVKNLIILSNGENVSPEEIESKLGVNPLISEIIITGEDNGLTARIYPDMDFAANVENLEEKLREILDDYNKNQPSYKKIVGLVIRKNPFIKNSTRKIKRTDVLIDEPQ